MKFNKQDWHQLQTTLIICGVLNLTVITLLVLAKTYTDKQNAILQAQQNQLNVARQRYQSSGLEKDMIAEYLPQYQQLISKGFIGEERRQDWVEELRMQHKNHQFFAIKYNISQQAEYKPTFAAKLGGFVLQRSVMKLDLDMLHEGDLLQLTESINAINYAPFMLRDCEITRLNSVEVMSDQLNANLRAQCDLDWFTMHEPVSFSKAELL